MHVIAAKAVAFKEALEPAFRDYQLQVVKNAKALAEAMTEEGLRLVSGGTDNHLILIDLTDKGVTGKDVEAALDRAGITTNKNGIPFDTKGPMITSGIRVGTPALTTRGMKEDEMRKIAHLITYIIDDVDNEDRIKEVKEEVGSLCEGFPLYMDRM